MIIDIAFGLLMLLALRKGYSRGLIIAVFSLLAFVVGIAAALKFSALVATWLGTHSNIGQQLLPSISFLIVFIAVAYLIKLGASIIEKSVKFVLLGWVNKLGGILFYAILYLLIFSVALFYAKQLNILSAQNIAESKVYTFVEPFGKKVIDGIGTVVPIFKNLFSQLQAFFENIKPK
jgi:membrane protein required for colicin V production